MMFFNDYTQIELHYTSIEDIPEIITEKCAIPRSNEINQNNLIEEPDFGTNAIFSIEHIQSA